MLQNGWAETQVDCANGAPSYYVSKGIAYLSGALYQPHPNGNGVIGTLPSTARPQHNLYLIVNQGPSGYAALCIGADGQIFTWGGTGQPALTSLAGIAYQVSS